MANKKKPTKKKKVFKIKVGHLPTEVKVNTDTVFAKLLFDLELEVQKHEQTSVMIYNKLEAISCTTPQECKEEDKHVIADFVQGFRSLLYRLFKANVNNTDNLQKLNTLI